MLLTIMLVFSMLAAVGMGLLTGAFAGFAWLWILPVSFLAAFLVAAAGVFAFLCVLGKRVDMDQPQDGDDPLYRWTVDLLLESLLPLVRVHVHTQGLEQTPRQGRFLLVCNHNNNADPLVLLRHFRGSQLAFVGKQEVRDMFLAGPFLHKLQGQFLNRENDREALKTIINCIRIIREDKASVAVFPEGGIHPDMKLHHFRSGVFKIAQKANVPIVVCTLRNTDHVISNVLHYRRSDLELHLVGVIPAEELKGVHTTDIAERVYGMMARDLGPELVAEE